MSNAREHEAPPPFAHVVFDCDSTLSAIEGIDELAHEHRAEIARLTERAMAGELRLEEVYGRRLELARPTAARIAALGRHYVDTCVPGARETVRALQGLGKRVSILSGGVRPAVMVLARHLGIAGEEVFAVELFHREDGTYDGYDQLSALTRDDGKPRILERFGAPRAIALVGDGATDLRCAPAVGRFIAFAGVVARANVVSAAAHVVRENDLRATLPFLLTPAERALVATIPTSARP
ncbi:MAG: HAD-IB family phosphatase [Planctomycetes bacterium]|nr:HAD-IB family phosphatase [Planctomycetota bacterium]